MIKNNQNIFDFTLENFGTLENLFTDVLVPNFLPIDQEIKPNQDINIDTFEKGNQTVKKQIQTKGLILTNGEIGIHIDSINYLNGVVTNAIYDEIAVFDFDVVANFSGDVIFTVNWGSEIGITIINTTLVDNVLKALQTTIEIPLGVDLSQTINVTDDFGGSYQVPYTVDPGSGYIAEFQAVYDEWTIKPDDADAELWNTMVETLVNAGEWGTKLDRYFFYAVHTNDNGEALLDWINPGINSATLVNNPAFVAFEGFTGNGVTSYIRTGWDASVNSNLSVNDAAFGNYSRTNVISTGYFDYGAIDANPSIIQFNPRYSGGNGLVRLNSVDFKFTPLTVNSQAFYIQTRDNASDIDVYRNKIKEVDASALNSLSVPTVEVWNLAMNNNGVVANLSIRQMSLFFGGLSFDQTDVNTMTDAVETVMDAKGKGVIP